MTDRDPLHQTTDWQPIETAPKDGRIVEMRKDDLASFHAFWADGRWQPIEFQHGLPATHWRLRP